MCAIAIAGSAEIRFCSLFYYIHSWWQFIPLVTFPAFILFLTAFIDGLKILFFEEIAYLLKRIFLFHCFVIQVHLLIFTRNIAVGVMVLSSSHLLGIK